MGLPNYGSTLQLSPVPIPSHRVKMRKTSGRVITTSTVNGI